MVIKMSKVAHFFVFSADGSKKSVTVGQSISVHLKGLVELFQKMIWLIGFGVTIREI